MSMRWIDPMELNVGDEVGVDGKHKFDRALVLKVDKKMANGLVLSDGSRWSKNGREHGSGESYYRRRLIAVAEVAERNLAMDAERRRNRSINRLRDVRWSEMTDEALAEFIALLDKHKPLKQDEEAGS